MMFLRSSFHCQRKKEIRTKVEREALDDAVSFFARGKR